MLFKGEMKEYFKELKIVYLLDEVTIYNYQSLYFLSDIKVELKKIIITGSHLKVIYQDPQIIKIKGKIDKVYKVDKNGIQN